MAADPYVIILDDIKAFEGMATKPDKVTTSIRQAINKTADRYRTEAARQMREEVAFPPSYLNPSSGRLIVEKKAQGRDLEAIITGRSRPTSLARFARPARLGVKVTVKPGLSINLPRAFFVNLRVGSDPQDSRSNTGLAIRLEEGQIPRMAYRPKLVGRGLWLLYGPSVDQAFKGIAQDVSPGAADFLQAEFDRLMGLTS